MTPHGTVPAVQGRILAICLVLITACYSPAQPDCGFICGSNGECPDDYTCAADGICHRNGSPANLICMVDARPDSPRPIDAPPADADFAPPALYESDPTNGATNISVATTIRVQFTEPVLYVDISSFTVSVGASAVTGTITPIDPLSYMFTPTAALPASSTVEVILTSKIFDYSGNALANTQFSFTTAP
jgi:hypothetical protein